ncbi:MAG TPA: HDOD domain-containing protein [Vicinamibacterales bacterium]|nr:HDOD domain-containing protein [Vicinamibacterales bacterium]
MAKSRPAATASILTFVARQPIFDGHRAVLGYELSFRPPGGGHASNHQLDYTTARAMADAVLGIGLETLTGGRRAFMSVSRRLLLEGIPAVLPAGRVVLELAADVEADRDVIDACSELKRAGYALAIDDYVATEWTADLVPFASFVKVDVRKLADAGRQIPVAGHSRPAIIAKGVETLDEFDYAVSRGCTYFQGFFFGRPLITQGRAVPGHQAANLRLLRALQNPEISVHELESLIKHDASLCYRILRTINSAASALQTTVHSVHEALVLRGRDTVRRWATLWALAGLNEHTHSELVVTATIRGRCCERLAETSGSRTLTEEGFLVGVSSMLDAILGRPMAEILAELPLSAEARGALLGEPNRTRQVLDCVIAYERGEWEACEAFAQAARLDASNLPAAYAEALTWTSDLAKP